MYRERVDALRPGHVVAENITDDDGRVLLRAGTALTDPYLDRLRARGVVAVYVQDGLADDLPVRDIVSQPLRRSVTSHLATVFDGAVIAAQVDPDEPAGGVDAAVDRMGQRPLRLDDSTRQAVARLYDDIELLLSEAVDNYAEAGLETLKTHNTYTYQHSVDVAAVGALLGHRAGLTRPELRELALGCLLHDIGKTFIDIAILDKPGKLTEAEFDEIKRHPELGFQIARRMPLNSILPAHVSFQHHERQDGSGYPQGLIGSNRLQRTEHERLDGRRMLLIAEIAAVADVYSALTSDRPYRRALHHDVAADMISEMAGAHLNRDVVKLFRRTFPPYPVGHWVQLLDGPRKGFRGVVAEVVPGRHDRPVVRLLMDARGEVLGSPEEIDLYAAPDTTIALTDRPELEAVTTA